MTRTIRELISAAKITMSTEWADENPAMPGEYNMNHYLCVLRRRNEDGQRRQMSLYFSQGFAHTEDPKITDVLDCLASDAAGVENARDFEDWASEYGYDTDSRKAEQTYLLVERQARKLKHFLGADLYETLLWDTERE